MRCHFLVLPPLLLLLSTFVEAKKQTAPVGTPLIQCLDCRAKDGKCTRFCQGIYCYKSEFTSSAPRGIIKVKRGCMNATDEGVSVGACRTSQSNLPQSDAQKTETLCICNSPKCNGSTQISILSTLLSAFLLILFAR